MDVDAHDSPVNAARWARVRQVFFAAIDVNPGDRDAFVRDTCAGDKDLEQTVLRLLQLDSEAGAFLDRPAIAELAPLIAPAELILHPNQLLAGRYRIVKWIGSGGMGEVYEADDEVIRDVVALKVLRSGFEPDEAMTARWRREVLLARKISHDGVCRVHDVATHREGGRELLFMTMERLRGESLAARLERGDLSIDEGMAILRQVAGALDAAHAQGVLHRDVKPDNIILEGRVEGVRAVLTDFGLAREIESGSAVTRPGGVAGTPGYVAPEVLRGESPSARSDLYAFALVVRNVVGAALPQLPEPLQAVLGKAAHVEPTERFGSATSLVQAVSSACVPSSTTGKRRRQVVTAVCVALLTVALLFSVVRFYKRDAATIVASSQVLLTDMTNGTGQKEFDGAGEVLRSQLAQSAHFELVEPRRVHALLAQMGKPNGDVRTAEIAREVALREGVPLVVFSALTQLGAEYSIGVRLERVGSRPSFAQQSWTHTFVAPAKAGMFDAMHQAAVWIREMAGETPAALQSQDRTPAETTTSSWEALRLFSQANALSAAGKLGDSTLVLEEALRLDPDFALAQMRLGDDLISLRRDKEGYAAWQRAFDLVERHPMTDRETLRIRSQYFEDTGDLAAAEKAHRTFVIHYPNDYYANFLLGGLLENRGRQAEAVAWMEKARAVRPQSFAPVVHLALMYLDLHRSADCQQAIKDLVAFGANDWVAYLRPLTSFVTGAVEDALRALDPIRDSADASWRSRYFTLKAAWLSELGRDAESLEELQRGIDFDRSQGFAESQADKWLHLADLERRLGRPAAGASAHKALAVATNARRVAIAVGILARMGDLPGATALSATFDDLPHVPTTEAARERALLEIALASGRIDDAAPRLERVAAAVRLRDGRLTVIHGAELIRDRGQAEEILTAIVDHPVALYSGPEPQSPGLWRQAIVALVNSQQEHDPTAAFATRTRFESLFREVPFTSSSQSSPTRSQQ